METWRRLLDFFRRDRLAAELDEELRFHHDRVAAEHRAEGRSDSDAEYDARRRMGNATTIAEDARSMWSFAWFEHLMQDLRYGVRTLTRSPGFAIVAALTLALGIGANTAIFTVVNGVLLRPLPYSDPGRLVMLWETTKDLPQILISYPNFRDWQGRVNAFDGAALYNGFSQFNLTGMGTAERVHGGLGTGNLFDVLGVHAALGRTFAERDDHVGADRVAVITDAFWHRRFAGDSGAVGRTIVLDGDSYTIVGVLPPRVRLAGSDVWMPIGLFANTDVYTPRNNHPGTIGLARLKPGATLAQMQADLDGLYRQLETDYPKDNAGIRASGDMMINVVLGKSIRRSLYVLAGAVGLVLLIACANVANLLLGRASSRQRELALRLALGARRGRVIRQLLTESVLLSAVGGALGTALAWAGVRLLLTMNPGNVPRLADIQMDGTVLVFAFVLSLLTGVLFGVVPAMHAARGDLVGSLRDGGRGATTGRQGLRMRSALMVAEVALALVLLVGAGLLVRSFAKLTSVDIGADARNVVAGLIALPERKYPDDDRRRAAFAELLAHVRSIPSVVNAAIGSDLPVNSSWQAGVTFERMAPVARGSEPLLNAVVTDTAWFSALRMRVIAGRTFTAADVSGAPPVVVITDGVARRLGGVTAAIGQRMKLGSATDTAAWKTIVGVVNDVRDGGLGQESHGTMFLPITQNDVGSMWLAVRTTAQAAAVVPALRKALAAIDKDVPLASVETLEEQVAGSVAQPRFSMLMLTIFATIALVLAAIGIYGVVSYSVALRTHEIGVRVALGANKLDVVGMIARQVLTITGLGIVIGALGALAAGGVLAQLLFGVQPRDPLTFVSVSLGLTLVALAAAVVPAWRAARLDPVRALRAE